VTILFSDRGLPKSYRQMNGYGPHTYSLINAMNERFWVKFHDAFRYDHRAGNDDYTQAGNLFRLMPEDERQHLFGNLATSMQDVPRAIIERQLEHFRKADPAYAEGVAKALGLARGKAHKAHAAD
jgi:catalase